VGRALQPEARWPLLSLRLAHLHILTPEALTVWASHVLLDRDRFLHVLLALTKTEKLSVPGTYQRQVFRPSGFKHTSSPHVAASPAFSLAPLALVPLVEPASLLR
jgi:hypothetical protein